MSISREDNLRMCKLYFQIHDELMTVVNKLKLKTNAYVRKQQTCKTDLEHREALKQA